MTCERSNRVPGSRDTLNMKSSCLEDINYAIYNQGFHEPTSFSKLIKAATCVKILNGNSRRDRK